LDEVAHDTIVNQINKLKDSNVTVVICDDAETITDNDVNKISRDAKLGDVT
jgi:hypothetical protein